MRPQPVAANGTTAVVGEPWMQVSDAGFPQQHTLCANTLFGRGAPGSTGKGAGRGPRVGEARPTGAGAQARTVAPSCWRPLGEGRRHLQSEVGLLQPRGTGALPHWLRRALLRVTGACGRNRSAEDTWPGCGACWPNCLSVRESVSESVCLLGHGCDCQGRGAPPAQLTQPHPSPGIVEMTGPWRADGHGAGRPAGHRTPPANGRRKRGWKEVETRSLQGSSPRGCGVGSSPPAWPACKKTTRKPAEGARTRVSVLRFDHFISSSAFV